jgi:Asp-tRNA(Asn)/Glu-tRNA(Gln) amidotransferase A subunit family amidase
MARIDALNPLLNAFTTLAPRDEILAGARAAEREIAAGHIAACCTASRSA